MDVQIGLETTDHVNSNAVLPQTLVKDVLAADTVLRCYSMDLWSDCYCLRFIVKLIFFLSYFLILFLLIFSSFFLITL